MNISDLTSELIDWRFKAFPIRDKAPAISEVPDLGWDAFTDFALPVLVLKDSAIQHNIDLMGSFCREHGVSLAPHAKTPLSPQIVLRQLAAGAWGLSVATIHHARVMRAAGVTRILLANQLLEKHPLEWIAGEMLADPLFDFTCLVDSQRGVDLMEGHLRSYGVTTGSRKLRVLLEMGVAGGRTGCRSINEARDLAARVLASEYLELAGVETYENVFDLGRFAESLRDVDRLLDVVRELVMRLDVDGCFAHLDEVIVSAGGSIYFDRVVERLTGWTLSKPVNVVLRSGSYVTQDAVNYGELSPLGGRRTSGEPLRQALELWATVLSRPERGLIVLGFGKRDVAHDRGVPIPFAVRKSGCEAESSDTLSVISLNDHHARCLIAQDQSLEVGDLVGLHVSHPCTTFDNWRLIPLVDDKYRVLDAIRSYL
jgi:D-serine deaminase-like pyridoxal phosphate-dependent protein